MMHFKTRLKTETNLIDLTALVDIIFLLLIFFIITSDILPLKSLNVETPEIRQDSLPLTTQMVVLMDKDHTIYVGKDKVLLPDLPALLRQQLAALRKKLPNVKPTVVLSVDRHVDYGTFLRLLYEVQDLGLTIRLSYQAAPHA
jgi:biopolymer transport protein ExbD